MKRVLTILMTIMVVLSFSCAAGNYVTTPDVEQSVVILHTNDHHGHPLSFYEYPAPGNAGLPARATLVSQVRAEKENVLVLDAGDFNTGRPESNFFKAEPDIIGYNAVGYDAVAIGNHEFDNSMEIMQEQIAQSEFPWLCANVKTSSGSYIDNVEPYVIKDMGEFKVAIIGLLTTSTEETGNPEYIKDLTFLDPVEVANELVPKLNSKADIVIALTHMGIYEENRDARRLAAEVPGLAAVISGHTHTKPEDYIEVTNAETGAVVPVVQAGDWGKYVGRLELKFMNGEVTGYTFEGMSVNLKKRITKDDGEREIVGDGPQYEEDPELLATLSVYEEKVDAVMSQVIGTASGAFDHDIVRQEESAAGDAVADSMMWFAEKFQLEPDFAYQNGGGVRANFAEGELNIGSVYEVLPFDNSVAVLEMTGDQVTALFEKAATNVGAGAMAQVSSNVSVTFNAAEETLVSLTINGEEVDPDEVYTVATNSYLASGGDGYDIFKEGTNFYDTSTMQRDAFIDYVKEALDGELVLATDGRLTIE